MVFKLSSTGSFLVNFRLYDLKMPHNNPWCKFQKSIISLSKALMNSYLNDHLNIPFFSLLSLFPFLFSFSTLFSLFLYFIETQNVHLNSVYLNLVVKPFGDYNICVPWLIKCTCNDFSTVDFGNWQSTSFIFFTAFTLGHQIWSLQNCHIVPQR